jgi:S1-C subfamily serine protease
MRKLLSILLTAVLAMPACASTIDREVYSTVLIHVKVQLTTPEGKRNGWGTCAGVYVEKNEILTASHCMGAYEENVKVKDIWVAQENGYTARATIDLISPEKDLCLLHTDLRGTPVHLGRAVHQGQDITMVGMPLDLSWILTKGVVSRVNFRFGGNPTRHFVTDATVLPGNSGGPTFDSRGRLVGIVVRSTSMFGFLGAAGLGFVVDISEIRGFLGRS